MSTQLNIAMAEKHIKSKTARCPVEGCNKKITAICRSVCGCKCGKTFCMEHRLPSTHRCEYDFRSEIDVEAYVAANKCVASKV